MSKSELSTADLAEMIAAKSDQINADDLLSGPIVGRVVRIKRGSAEQPMAIMLTARDVPWLPCKTDRRVLIAVWGDDPRAWIGRSVRLVRDPEVMFGKLNVGGIRIDAVSDIAQPMTLAVTVARGRKAPRRIGVLTVEQPAAPTLDARRASAREAIGRLGLTAEAEEHVQRDAGKWNAADLDRLRTFLQERQKQAPVAEPDAATSTTDDMP